ncbi:hypothetical protein NDU88_004127 [Pleurodeles waltl]|uniref:Uncharacterized protein n=1 Tax=Pleurodeles waltl TaxID=8319 RepID=A0AAV7UF84_PLEWA|nr:hypothetical protein NDU88_004127 [Pleurodeles waltl]
MGPERGGYQSALRLIGPLETEIAARPSRRKRQIFGRVRLYKSELLAATLSWPGEPEEELAGRGSTRGPGLAGSDYRRTRSDGPRCLYQFLGAINILHMRDGNRAGDQGVRRYHAGRCKGATLLPEADLQGDSQYNVK